jgi:hypothetical protein
MILVDDDATMCDALCSACLGFTKHRYRGLAKNAHALFVLRALMNPCIWRDGALAIPEVGFVRRSLLRRSAESHPNY